MFNARSWKVFISHANVQTIQGLIGRFSHEIVFEITEEQTEVCYDDVCRNFRVFQDKREYKLLVTPQFYVYQCDVASNVDGILGAANCAN